MLLVQLTNEFKLLLIRNNIKKPLISAVLSVSIFNSKEMEVHSVVSNCKGYSRAAA